MKLALQLSCYNGSRYLPHLFASLAKQSCRDWQLFILDNASRPEEGEAIARFARASGLPHTLTRVEANVGFAGGHNVLWSQHAAEFTQLLNDDAVLEPDYLKNSLEYLESHPSVAAVTGKILRWDFDRRDEPGGGRTQTIDSLGLERRWTGAIADIGSGRSETEVVVPSSPRIVFGVSGCLPMYRSAAVRKASPDGALFDGAYVLYKEDVDLAYRLRAAGYGAAIVPTAVAYHRRSLGSDGRSQASAESKVLSYRNHLWTILTDLSLKTALAKTPLILPYELAKIVYWLVKDPVSLGKNWRATMRQWPKLMQKRRFVQHLWKQTSQ